VQGSESLDWAYVKVIDRCALGESDPAYPECAKLAIPLNTIVTSFGSIEARAKPFTGALVQEADGRWVLRLSGRRIELEVGDFIVYVLDQLTVIATLGEYETLEDALVGAIDCYGIALALHDTLCNSFDLCGLETTLEQGCLYAAHSGVVALEQELNQVTVDWDAMKFDASARVYYVPATGNATHLGKLPADPGALERGDFEVLVGADLQGRWVGTRP
jgi:hypothetical protein